MSSESVDQKKLNYYCKKRVEVEVRRKSSHRAVLVGFVTEYDEKSLVLAKGDGDEALIYINDVSTISPRKEH